MRTDKTAHYMGSQRFYEHAQNLFGGVKKRKWPIIEFRGKRDVIIIKVLYYYVMLYCIILYSFITIVLYYIIIMYCIHNIIVYNCSYSIHNYNII